MNDRTLPLRVESLVGTVLDGRYELLERIGKGGMGEVYRARHVSIKRDVAVKVLNVERLVGDKVRRRFEREGRATAAIEHSNIVKVIDFGTSEDGEPYLVMEYLSGADLAATLRTYGAMSAVSCVVITRQILAALAAAHRRGIVHRDLKSHNVFLVDGEPEHHRVRLLDFGISKLLEPLGDGTGETALTTEGAILGTPHYLAPEQFDGSVDPRSDLYSLGVVMFEMLSGDLPFRAKSPVAVMMMHAKEPPPRPSVRRPDLEIPAAIESVVMKALSKAPDDRFSSAEAMSRALDEAVASSPELRLASAWAARSPSRRRAIQLVTASVVAALGVGIVAWMATRDPEAPHAEPIKAAAPRTTAVDARAAIKAAPDVRVTVAHDATAATPVVAQPQPAPSPAARPDAASRHRARVRRRWRQRLRRRRRQPTRPKTKGPSGLGDIARDNPYAP